MREKKAHEKLIQESLIEPASPYGASAAFILGARIDVKILLHTGIRAVLIIFVPSAIE